MMKSWKRILCMVLAGVMLFSTGVVTQAAPVQTAEINSIEGLDQYLSKNQDGTISLDESAAQDAGYTQEAIAYVQENISYMNDMARTKGAYIDDQFKMIYAEGPMTRARGVNKVEMLWNGNIDIYMDSDQAEVYVDGVEKAIAEAEKLGGIVSLIVPMLGLPIGVSILDAYLILNMAKMAKSAGTGIIMHIQRDYVTQTDTYSFSPQ
ncbi:MAG: hypothetical protein ACLRS1_06515 [Oscillospiraceae bacterium]|mgnify:CR=1 FL=1